MEGNDTEAASRIQKVYHGINGLFQNLQLMVAFNADSLKGPFGRMASRCPYPGRNGPLYDLRQLPGGLYGVFPSCPYNCLLYTSPSPRDTR